MVHQKQELELKGKLYTPNVMKADLIDTVKTIYKACNVNEYNVVNVDTNDNQGAMFGQMLVQANAIKDSA